MTVKQLINKLHDISLYANPQMLNEFIAVEFEITDSRKNNIFYIEVKNQKINTEPYSYNDRQCEVKITADKLMNLILSKTDINSDNFKKDFVVNGNFYKFMALIGILKKAYEKQIESKPDSSAETLFLMSELGSLVAEFSKKTTEDEKAYIVPELNTDSYRLWYTLKIGRDKMYVVRNISDLMRRFRYEENYSYGKSFTFKHDLDTLDEQSNKLLNLSYCIYRNSQYGWHDGRVFELNGTDIDSFFEIYKDNCITIENTDYSVVFENPPARFIIQQTKNGSYNFQAVITAKHYGMGRRGCFIDRLSHTVYMADTSFSKILLKLEKAFKKRKNISIAEKDIEAFYSVVIKPLSKYSDIEGMEILEKFTPPEMTCSLYLDTTDCSNVTAKAYFQYADKTYPLFYEQSNNPFCDYENENIIVKEIMKYFRKNEKDQNYPLIIEKEKDIYCLMSEGIPLLSKLMDIFTAESYNRFMIRPPVKTTVGIRPGEYNLLNLDITAEGFSTEELLALLNAYRKGKKYHRLKDGSFAQVDDSIAELSEITQGLNINDKTFLKGNIAIPKYRMLYLDSLKKDCRAVRIDRSNEFKKIVKNYRASIEDFESFTIPSELNSVMRDYQKHGYRWMRVIASYGFGGILADDMGLGKTLQAISLITEYKNNNAECKPCLVVCPSSLMLNWESEIQKFAPALKTIVISGVANNRGEMLGKIGEYDVAITSYSLIIRDIAEYEQYRFKYQFIDEAQYIKNHTTQMSKAVKAISADVKYALTGTPVENSLAELWSIFDYIMPGYLFNYTHFKKVFESPIVTKHDSSQVKALQKIVSPFILRRMKSEVLHELPDKTETILRSDMSEEQSKLYSANVAEARQLVNHKFGSQTERFKVLAMITRLRQICCDPDLYYENYKGGSAKSEQCMELISECIQGGHKILLFSQFTSMLDIIAEKLTASGYSYYMLTGKTSPKARIKMVNSFNEDSTQIFLISLKAGGTGLNLTGADIVIHFDPWWNVSAENQASDRVYRIGQKRNVQIYKLIAANTIEEKILKLQESKSELFDIAVNGEGDIMHMSESEILELLE